MPNRRKAILYVSRTCHWCGQAESAAKRMKIKIKSLDGPDGRKLAMEKKITYVPTLIVYEGGREIRRCEGVPDGTSEKICEAFGQCIGSVKS